MTPSGCTFSSEAILAQGRVNFSQILSEFVKLIDSNQMYKTVSRNLQQLLPSVPIGDQILIDMTFRVLCRHCCICSHS